MGPGPGGPVPPGVMAEQLAAGGGTGGQPAPGGPGGPPGAPISTPEEAAGVLAEHGIDSPEKAIRVAQALEVIQGSMGEPAPGPGGPPPGPPGAPPVPPVA